MKLIDLIDDMEVKKWVLIFCILGVSFTDNVADIKLAEVFSNKKVKEWVLIFYIVGVSVLVLKESIKIASQHVGQKDYKTVLQEKLQKNGEVEIKYTIIKETGPDHDKTFEAQVECNHKILAIGSGKSKKLAEMEAARRALNNIK